MSRDGEYVELAVEGDDWKVDLGARASNEMLLLLARARIEDAAARPDVARAEHGWLYTDELCTMADMIKARLDLHVFRARKQLAAAGIRNPGQIVERRPSTRQLRLGTDNVQIEQLS